MRRDIGGCDRHGLSALRILLGSAQLSQLLVGLTPHFGGNRGSNRPEVGIRV